MSDVPDQPSPNRGDVAHFLTRLGISLVPGVGGAGVELFNALITPPVVIRRNEWLSKFLEELNKRVSNLEDVVENPQFVTAFLQALPMAVRTHQQEKRDALRNAVLNVALSQAPEETRQHIFLNYVDSMTPLHLNVLRYVRDRSVRSADMEEKLTRTHPDSYSTRDIYDQIWQDLFSKGLVTLESLYLVMSTIGDREKLTSRLGDDFLAFVSEPSTIDLSFTHE